MDLSRKIRIPSPFNRRWYLQLALFYAALLTLIYIYPGYGELMLFVAGGGALLLGVCGVFLTLSDGRGGRAAWVGIIALLIIITALALHPYSTLASSMDKFPL